MQEIIRKMCEANGVSGQEDCAAEVFKQMVEPFCDEIFADDMGNINAIRRCGKENAPLVMIEAHIDKVGLMIKNILPGGYLAFCPIGGIDTKILPALQVIIYGKREIKGIIGSVPPHIKKNSDKSPKIDQLFIDTGLSTEQLSDAVSVGDTAEFDTQFTTLLNGGMAMSAFDDRAGAATLIKCLQMLKDDRLNVDVCAVGAVQEEVGLRGAKAAAYNIKPDMAICVDVCHAKTPDCSDGYSMRGGTVITVGANTQGEVTRRLLDIAKEKNIPFNIDADPGYTGTDAWELQVSGKGIKTALLSIPLRYMHTPYEVIDEKDALYTAALMAEFIRSK